MEVRAKVLPEILAEVLAEVLAEIWALTKSSCFQSSLFHKESWHLVFPKTTSNTSRSAGSDKLLMLLANGHDLFLLLGFALARPRSYSARNGCSLEPGGSMRLIACPEYFTLLPSQPCDKEDASFN